MNRVVRRLCGKFRKPRRAADSVPVRRTALNHERADNAVKNLVFVETVVRQSDEVPDCQRRDFREQHKRYIAEIPDGNHRVNIV
jgi:hypothetical protein